jgi:hypothetical protein
VHALTERRSRIGMVKTQMMHTKRAICTCAGGDKEPPPPTENQSEETNNPEDHIIGEVRDLFAQDTVEEV